MPALFTFADEYKDYKDQFVILTFQYGRGKDTFAQLDPELAKLEKARWGGQKFPFPILLDSSGKTLRDWSINAYPTTVLIAPDGNIFANDHFKVEEKLAAELKKTGKPKGDKPSSPKAGDAPGKKPGE